MPLIERKRRNVRRARFYLILASWYVSYVIMCYAISAKRDIIYTQYSYGVAFHIYHTDRQY